ncbi:MAG TPA: phosphoribosyltransferase family protein, partial [Roseivirga sp.]
SEVLKVPMKTDGMARKKHVETQTKKSKVKRIQNVESIFELTQSELIEGKSILLVDDVLTTGSTLISCAEQIINGKPKSLSIAVMAGVK